MAIPVEFFSVFSPKATINNKYPGGIEQYKADCPNASYLEDEYLCRIGFMSDIGLHKFCTSLIEKGFHFNEETNTSTDFVVITNLGGLRWYVPWVSFDEDGYARPVIL